MNKIDLFKPQDQGGQALFHLLLRRAQAVSPLCSGGGIIAAARKHLAHVKGMVHESGFGE